MTKRKKLAKEALKHPDLFSQGELAFFKRWLQERKLLKKKKAMDAPAKEPKGGKPNLFKALRFFTLPIL